MEPTIPYLFYFYFVKECIRGCFLSLLFCVLSEVQITLQNPTILWKIFNMNTLVPLFPWFQMSELRQKTMQILGCRKKIIKKFPTLRGGRGGLGDLNPSLMQHMDWELTLSLPSTDRQDFSKGTWPLIGILIFPELHNQGSNKQPKI